MNEESPEACARRLLAEAREGALATLGDDVRPLTTLVTLAIGDEGNPLFLLSRLALHTQNLARDPRASLLVSDAPPTDVQADAQARARASLNGTVAPLIDAAAIASARDLFLCRHPAAETYVDFTDFRFYAMTVTDIHLVQGFGRINKLPGTILAG